MKRFMISFVIGFVIVSLLMIVAAAAAPSSAKLVTVTHHDYHDGLRTPVRYPSDVTTTTAPQPSPQVTLPALGAPSNLRASITYSDYRGASVVLSWSDNSSAETAFVLQDASLSDCRDWSNHDVLTLPPNTSSYTWIIPPGSYRGVGMLHAHGVAANSFGGCPQDYKLIARNASGDSAPSNVIVLDADSPNSVSGVQYHMTPAHLLEVRWRYTSKNYFMDANGITCFALTGVTYCAGVCYSCSFVYARDGEEYVATLSQPAYWGGNFPACVDVSVVVMSDGGPLPYFAGRSPIVNKCQG